MYIILPFIFAFIFAILDGSYATLVANMLIILLGIFYTYRVDSAYRKKAQNILAIVYIVYLSMAYVCCQSFIGGGDFYVSDPANYISEYLKSSDTSFDFVRMLTYFTIMGSDVDVLYVESLKVICGFANNYLGGATVYYMTLLQTLFGVLSCLTLYQILVRYFKKDAYKCTLIFSCCSLFLLYSSLIIRDIIISYFFLEATRIVLDRFKLYNVFVLILLAFLAAGIRLLSGAYLGLFVIVYIYAGAKNTRIKNLVLPLVIFVAGLVLYYIVSSVFYETSMESISIRQDNTMKREAESGGLINSLLNLPNGIRQIAIALFSQVAPFPPYGTLSRASTIPQVIMGLDVFIYEIFWYFVSYTLLIALLTKKVFHHFTTEENLLLIMAYVFILVLTTHPDIRRMMPVYPIIYLLYLKTKKTVPIKWQKNTKSIMVLSYFVLVVVYFSIKGI